MMSSPGPKVWLRAQPESVARCSGASAVSAGDSSSSSAIVRIRISPRVGRSDRGDLLSDVDGHRAPGDAASAADAARGAELVDPRRQLVRHPLAVARAARTADAPAVDVGVLEGEARVP